MLEIILKNRTKGRHPSALERLAGLSANRIAKWKSGQGEPSFSEAVRTPELGREPESAWDMPDDVPRNDRRERRCDGRSWIGPPEVTPDGPIARLPTWTRRQAPTQRDTPYRHPSAR